MRHWKVRVRGNKQWGQVECWGWIFVTEWTGCIDGWSLHLPFYFWDRVSPFSTEFLDTCHPPVSASWVMEVCQRAKHVFCIWRICWIDWRWMCWEDEVARAGTAGNRFRQAVRRNPISKNFWVIHLDVCLWLEKNLVWILESGLKPLVEHKQGGL